MKLSKAKKVIFKHCDMKDLERKLKKCNDFENWFVIIEGVFSMEGDIPDLKEVVRLCKKYKARFFLDDCHGIGVLGKTGRGAQEFCGIDINDVDLLIGTLSKAFGGGGGGYVAGKYDVVKWLNQRSRSYIFSSQLGPPVVMVAWYCIKYINDHPEMLAQHKKKILHFRTRMKKAGFEVMGNDETAVCPVFLRQEIYSLKIADALMKRGLYVVAVGFPATPIGTARIRMIIQSAHTMEQIDKCVELFIEVAEELCYFDFMKTYTANNNPLTKLIKEYGIKLWLKSWFIPVDMRGGIP
jgi:glycine C-acetyltransferase